MHVCTMYVYKYNLMYLLCMIKARIRWCTCRVENILTLCKLLSLWFCFLLHSILFFISQTSYRTYKIISSYDLACPVMGTIFLVYSPTIPSFAAITVLNLVPIAEPLLVYFSDYLDDHDF